MNMVIMVNLMILVNFVILKNLVILVNGVISLNLVILLNLEILINLVILKIWCFCIVGKKRDPGILDPEPFLAQIRKVEARLGKLAKIRKVETDWSSPIFCLKIRKV